MTARQTTEHWMELDGLRVFHRSVASGPEGAAQRPLLLIHGISCCTGYSLQIARVFWHLGPRRYLQTARRMQQHDAFVAAQEVSCPALVLQGSRDAIIPKRAGEGLARALPYGTYDTLPGAPHAAQYSDPPRTADRVLAFLRGSPHTPI